MLKTIVKKQDLLYPELSYKIIVDSFIRKLVIIRYSMIL